MLGVVVAVMLTIGNSPGHGQETDDKETQEPTSLAEPASAEPVVTRAWAHDDFGRIVFDWPRAVEYEARIEEKTLTVMFNHPLKTTFRQVERYLGAYISDVNLSPDGRGVTAALTGDYRLRTFTLSDESGVTKVVVDLRADGGASPVLAQAPASPPPPEPSPEAVPGDVSRSPAISGGSPLPPTETAPVDVVPGGAEPTTESEADPTEAPPTASEDADATDATAMETPDADPPRPFDFRRDAPYAQGERSAVRAERSASEVEAQRAAATPPGRGEAAAEAPSVPVDAGQADAETPPADSTSPAEDVSATETVPMDVVPADTEPTTESEADPTEAPPDVGAGFKPAPTVPDATPEPSASAPETEAPRLLSIPVSQSRLFQLDVPAASVFVANPDIADVQLVASGVLFVVAKAVGRTSVAALDADSALIAEWTIVTIIDVEPVRAALEEVEALKTVAVRQLNRGVELSGSVASVAEADLALRLATTALPEEIPVQNRLTVSGAQQINLEVQIAEVQRSVSETLGINWEVVPNLDGSSLAGFRVGRLFLDDETGRFIAAALPGGQAAAAFGGGIAGRTTVRGLIDALATAGLATVLARPNVTAISGETASFFSGGEFPLPAGFEDGAIIFEYKKYGVLLDFVPTIVDSGRIVLTVRPEVSERSETDSLRVTGIDIPVINVRRAETTVEVGDGESIVIAGLYRDQGEAVETGVPVLKDIPLLNLLFGTRTVRSNATELIVVVTARLTDAATVPAPADRQTPGRRLRGYHY